MKDIYLLRVTEDFKPCIADVTQSVLCSHWHISRINVPYRARGNGYGSQILKQIIDDADSERVDLCLLPVATGGLKTDVLIAWYKRNGFVFHGSDHRCVMTRAHR